MNPDALIAEAKFNADGLVTAIAQDAATNEVLMLAYMNEATLRQTVETSIMTYWNRSRKKVWVKGESSGNVQHVKSIHIDCDGDALLFKVEEVGRAACHTGMVSCFYRRLDEAGLLEEGERVFDPAEVYGKK